MTEIEVAEKIVEQGNCRGISCTGDNCPSNSKTRCLCGDSFRSSKTESQLQWFKDFLKGAKGMNGIDKAEAKKRLDVIEEEARKLREIIEKGDRIEYDDSNVYIAQHSDGDVYILAGRGYQKCFAFYKFSTKSGHASELVLASVCDTGQEAIDMAARQNITVHVFTDTRKAFEFFLEHYKG
jgi:hypothetical protein